jgi:outer membrane protein insertion porin family
MLGLSLIYDKLDNRVHPTSGHLATVNVDFAGLGGSVKYLRFRANASKYWNLGKNWIFSVSAEGGAIKSLDNRNIAGVDDIYLTDRFYLGEPQIRGFDIRGVGPRVIRKPYVPITDPNDPTKTIFVVSTDRNQWNDDAIGGKYYYLAHLELEIPLGSGAKELGIRPSIFVDAGAVWGVKAPLPIGANGEIPPGQEIPLYKNAAGQTVTEAKDPATGADNTPYTTIGPFRETFGGNTPKPRIAVGIGFNWNSPMGPFRIDFAKAITKDEFDDLKSFTFNVGTQF